MKRAFSAILLVTLLTSMLCSAFKIIPVGAAGTIYIRADGSIDPPTAPISTLDNVTYTLTGNIYDAIIVERDNIEVDGAHFTVQGAGGDTGIMLVGRKNVTIKDMKISDFSRGIRLESSTGNTILGNSITAIAGDGIYIAHSYGNAILTNTISVHGVFGIYLGASDQNTIRLNCVDDVESGILFEGASDNIVIENDWANCEIYFYHGYTSANNTFYHNNFLNSVLTPDDSVCTCDDGYPNGGNYWTSYHGTDLYSGSYQNESGSDSIGDTPYIIDAVNQDHYPLMNPWNSTIYIRTNGDVYPSNAPIFTADFVGYTLTSNIISKDDGIVIERDNITLEGAGYQLLGAEVSDSKGIDLTARSNVTIRNMRMNKFYDGIYFDSSSGNSISGNNMTVSHDGIFLNSATHNSIHGNNMTFPSGYGSVGIELAYSSNNTISENDLRSDSLECGMFLYDSGNNTIFKNKIMGIGGTAVWFYNSSNNDLCQNNMTLENGVRLELSQYNNIYCNNIETPNLGIDLGESSNNNIWGNNITSSECILSVDSFSSYNNISANRMIGGGVGGGNAGIWVGGFSSSNNISLNEIANSDVGIWLSMDSFDNSVYDNRVSNNGEGVCLYYSSNNNIYGNSIENNRCGIYVYESSNNTIIQNKIKASSFLGFRQERSSCNFIHHNSFIENAEQVSSEESINAWDDGYPSGGNYWSSYLGADLQGGIYQNETGSDMIGDSPCVIDANNTDHYPLMGPWTVTGENVTVTYASGVSLTFGNVTDAGVTTVSQTGFGPDLPSGFKLATNPPAYYDIKTTANYSGTIKLTIQYNDAGLTQEQENNLSLMHWNEALQQWTNITTLTDTENNVIYGETDSFSIFAIITPVVYGAGDINKDKIVDIFDITIVALAFSSIPNDPNWNLVADINGDEVVDIFDIVVVALHFGETG